jgi:type 1 glutamine amidotransferase
MKKIIAIFVLFVAISAHTSVAEQPAKKAHIVFLITKDTNNYEADITIPVFAEKLRKEHGYDVTVLLGEGDHGSYRYPSVDALANADLLVVFARRIALPHEQMNMIKEYVKKGKPVVGIRTANHAFKVNGKIEQGYEDWFEFVADVLGCENKGYGPQDDGAEMSVLAEAVNHPIVRDVRPLQWHGKGSLYLVSLLDKQATVLMHGKHEGNVQPVAWTRVSSSKNKVFYTSLGHPSDFALPQFNILLVNGIKWALGDFFQKFPSTSHK